MKIMLTTQNPFHLCSFLVVGATPLPLLREKLLQFSILVFNVLPHLFRRDEANIPSDSDLIEEIGTVTRSLVTGPSDDDFGLFERIALAQQGSSLKHLEQSLSPTREIGEITSLDSGNLKILKRANRMLAHMRHPLSDPEDLLSRAIQGEVPLFKAFRHSGDQPSLIGPEVEVFEQVDNADGLCA